MLIRTLSVGVAIAIAGAVAITVPQVSESARNVAAAVPGMSLISALAAKDPAGATAVAEGRPAEKDNGVEKDGHAADGDGHGHNGPGERESGGGKDGVLELDDEQIGASGVKTAKAASGTLARRLTVPGVIVPAADRVARVAAKVVGTVSELKKQLGDKVAKGEIVAVVESREVAEAKGAYLSAVARLELQKTLFERDQRLSQKNIIAEQQFLRSKASLSEVELQMELTRQKLSAIGLSDAAIADLSRQSVALQRYELRAPIGGRIVERLVSLGAPVGGEGQAKELYGIADLSKVWVELAISPRDLAIVRERQKVEVAISGGSARAEGVIVFKSPILDPETRAARVVAQIANEGDSWQPGSFVTAEILLEEKQAEVVIPKEALQTVENESVVFVRIPKGFEKREVAVGRRDARSAEVVFGLDPGEEIAVSNSFILKAELGKSEATHAH